MATTTTDDSGVYSFGDFTDTSYDSGTSRFEDLTRGVTYRIRSRLEGPYVKIIDQTGIGNLNHNQAVVAGSRHDWTWNYGYTIPDTGYSPNNHAFKVIDNLHKKAYQQNVFYHVNRIHDWYLDNFGLEWDNDGDKQMHVKVGADFYSFASPFFRFLSIGTVDRGVRDSDVIYHEYTHLIVVKIFNGSIGDWSNYGKTDDFIEGKGMDEAISDYFAAAISNDPNVALRWINQFKAVPQPLGTDPHVSGIIISGALWNLRQSIGASHTDGLVFDALWIMSTLPRRYEFADFLDAMLIADGLPSNGGDNNIQTPGPYAQQIVDEFRRRRISPTVDEFGKPERGATVEMRTISLARGFNLIGLPLDPLPPLTAYTLITDIPCESVFNFSEDAQVTRLPDGSIVGSDFPITLGGQYIIRVDDSTDWNLVGQPIASLTPLQLVKGFNMVSLPHSTVNYTAFTLLQSLSDVDLIFRYDRESETTEHALFIDTILSGTNFPIEPNEIYFIRAIQPISFIPTAPPVAVPPLAQNAHPLPAPPVAPEKEQPAISHVYAANLSAVSATITWVTAVPVDGRVHYGTMPALGQIAAEVPGKKISHWVRLTGLKPKTTYYYHVVSEGKREDNPETLHHFTTADFHSLDDIISLTASTILLGKIERADGKSHAGRFIHVTAERSGALSSQLAAIVDANGYWSVNLWNLKGEFGAPWKAQIGDSIQIRDYSSSLQFETQLVTRGVQNMGNRILPVEPTPFHRIVPPQPKLFQNFPNPFNPETWIPYQLSQDAEVAVRIYSAMGQLVRTLHPGFQAAGYYTTRQKAAYWDGRNEAGERVSSGPYFYNIESGDFFETKRMIVLK